VYNEFLVLFYFILFSQMSVTLEDVIDYLKSIDTRLTRLEIKTSSAIWDQKIAKAEKEYRDCYAFGSRFLLLDNWRADEARRTIGQYKKRVEDLYQQRQRSQLKQFREEQQSRLKEFYEKWQRQKILENVQEIKEVAKECKDALSDLSSDIKCLQDMILTKVEKLVVQNEALEVVPQEPEKIVPLVEYKPEEAAAVPELVVQDLQLSVADNISSLSSHISLIEETTKMISKKNVKPFTMVLRSNSRNNGVARQFAEAPD